MSQCPNCSSPVKPGDEECGHCGCPVGEPAPAPAGSADSDLWKPPPSSQQGKRQTVVGGVGAGGGRFLGGGAASDRDDPFAVAATAARAAGAGTRGGGRKTQMWGGAAADGPPPVSTQAPSARSDPDDPFKQSLAQRPAAREPLVGMLLTFSSDPNGLIVPLHLGKTTFGRVGDPGITIGLDDPAVSTPHCTVIARPAGMLLKDEGSTNGTWYKGAGAGEFRDVLADMVQLAEGDQLRVGSVLFLVRTIDRELISRIWPDR